MENIFHDVYEKLTTDTRAHADVFNTIFDQLFQNDSFLKKVCDLAIQHMNTSDVHVTEEDKANWTNKAEKTLVSTQANGLMSATDKQKVDSIENGAEVNQNAFSTVVASGIEINADRKTAGLELVAGTNITIKGDNETKRVIINGPDFVNNAGNTNTLQGLTPDQILAKGSKHLAGQGYSGGYSFINDGAYDTGLFSNYDGDLYLMRNGVVISLPLTSNSKPVTVQETAPNVAELWTW